MGIACGLRCSFILHKALIRQLEASIPAFWKAGTTIANAFCLNHDFYD
ncbi:MAG: hypothetical protein ABI203_10765 [Mucilaginibacter sp.]